MSLINDALVDLEKRREVQTDTSREKSMVVESRFVFRPAFLFVLGVSCMCAFYLGKYGAETELAETAVSTEVFVPEVVTKNSAVVISSLIDNKVSELTSLHNEQVDDVANSDSRTEEKKPSLQKNKSAAVSTAVTTIDSTNAESSELSELLWHAEEAINRNRLTVPVGASALFYLSAIRQLDPDNLKAISLQKRTREKFLQLVDQSIRNQELSRAQVLINRLEYFDISESAVKHYRDLYLSLQQKEQRDNPRDVVAVKQKNVDTEKTVSSRESMWITTTFASKENDLVNKAKTYIAEGEDDKAELILNDFLSKHPDSVVIASFIFDMYWKDGDIDKPQILINSLPKEHAATAYFNARLSMQANNIEKAVEILERNAPEDAIYLKHNGLLAALYQKMKAYQKAKQKYARLLIRKPNSEKFLLGFALSSDQLGHTEDSLRAYQTLSKLGHSQQAVHDFVKKRLRELNETQSLAEVDTW